MKPSTKDKPLEFLGYLILPDELGWYVQDWDYEETEDIGPFVSKESAMNWIERKVG